MFRWAYFMTFEELVNRHKQCGGKRGTFNPRNAKDIEHARRAIFYYLLPEAVRVWNASLDDKLGMVFFVGKFVREPHEAFTKELASRCHKAFERVPNPCKVVPNTLNLHWEFTSHNKVKHRLELIEFLGSDRDGDMYPFRPDKYSASMSSDM